MLHNQKNNDMKEGDLILVSAEATGLGKPMEAVIDIHETNPCNGHLHATKRLIRLWRVLCGFSYHFKRRKGQVT